MQQAIFGGGCFWCTESVFLHVKGVTHVESVPVRVMNKYLQALQDMLK